VDAPVNHSDYEDLAAGFALDALEPDEELAFRRHLEGCPACRSSVRELEEVTAALALATPLVEPPASLRAAVRRGTGLTLRRRAARMLSSWRGTRITVRVVAAAGVLALFALSLWNLALRDQHLIDRARVNALEEAVRVVNDATANRVVLKGSAADGGARATVLASSRLDRGVLVVEGLPPPPAGRVYELWALRAGEASNAAKAMVFRFGDREGVHALPFSVNIQPTTGFAVTEEPGPGGSLSPTTEPVLAGKPQPSRPGGA
jgi:Anti-sigma-K factor rskA/Putative zinc-finger